MGGVKGIGGVGATGGTGGVKTTGGTGAEGTGATGSTQMESTGVVAPVNSPQDSQTLFQPRIGSCIADMPLQYVGPLPLLLRDCAGGLHVLRVFRDFLAFSWSGGRCWR